MTFVNTVLAVRLLCNWHPFPLLSAVANETTERRIGDKVSERLERYV